MQEREEGEGRKLGKNKEGGGGKGNFSALTLFNVRAAPRRGVKGWEGR